MRVHSISYIRLFGEGYGEKQIETIDNWPKAVTPEICHIYY